MTVVNCAKRGCMRWHKLQFVSDVFAGVCMVQWILLQEYLELIAVYVTKLI